MRCKWIGLITLSLLAASCVYHDIPEPCRATLAMEVTQLDNASKCGIQDGRIAVEVTGGKPPYSFSINGKVRQESPVFSALESGLYSVTVEDANKCSTRIDSILISVNQFEISFLYTPDDECLLDSGGVEITVLEDNHPYQFNLDDNGFTADSLFTNLKDGDHFLDIKDNHGCAVKMKIAVPKGFTDVSWQNDILPIMTTSCAVPNCHNGVSRPNDWRLYPQVKQYAATIREKTQNRSMPFDTTLPQDKIDLIACWVDDGALEN